MALVINRGEKPRTGMISDRRLYLTASKDAVVEDGDQRAAFLFATPGWEVPAGDVERYGLTLEDGKVVLPGVRPDPVQDASSGEAEGGGGSGEDETDGAEETADGSLEWTLKTSPEEYLKRSPDGPNAELARQILEARAEDGSGDA